MKEYYEKVLISREQAPEVSGWYDTNLGRTFFRLLHISRNPDYAGWFESDINMNTKVYPNYYFEQQKNFILNLNKKNK